MKSPPQRLTAGTDGPPRLIRAINELREYVIGKSIRRVLGGKVRETTGGTSIIIDEAEVSEGALGESRRALIQMIHGDYYECTIDGEYFNVAKPWRLRRNPFHGNSVSFIDEQGRTYAATYTYEGSGDVVPSVRRSVSIVSAGTDTFSESQVVVPRIKVTFDYIDVIASSNGTGLTDIDLIDLNTDGRAWARER